MATERECQTLSRMGSAASYTSKSSSRRTLSASLSCAVMGANDIRLCCVLTLTLGLATPGALAQPARESLSDAEQRLRSKVAQTEKTPGPHGVEHAKALLDLGTFYRNIGRPDQADVPLRKSLELARQPLAADPSLAFYYNQVGLLKMEQGHFAQAESLLTKALEIRKAARGIDPVLLAVSHDNLGNFLLARDRPADAEPHLQAALRLFLAALGPVHPDTLICVQNVADLYARTQRVPEAIDLLSRALQAMPAESQRSARVELLKRRGRLLARQQQYAEAQADLGYAIDLAGQDPRLSPTLVQILIDQAQISKQLVLPEQGDALLERAQQLVEARPNPDRATLANIWNLRGWFKSQLDELPQAIEFLKRAVADARARDPAKLSVMLINLSIVQVHAGALDAAQANTQEAVKLLTARSPEARDLAECYNLLGSILERRGQPRAAEAHYRRALAMLQRFQPDTDPAVVNVKSNLALLLQQNGRPAEALELARVRAAAFEVQLAKLLKDGSEEEARAYVRNQNPFSLFASIGQAGPLAQAIFNYQSVVTDAMAELRARRRLPQQRESFNRWRAARAALTHWTLAGSAGGAAAGDRLMADLATAQASFARSAGREISSARFDLRVEDVARQIPADAALVDYLRYSQYVGRTKSEDHYGVLVLMRDGAPRWFPLGKATELEGLVEVYGRAVRGRDPVNSLTNVLRELHARLLAPVLENLPAPVTRVLLVPDGELNFVSFAALMDKQDRFVGERYFISYLASARGLLRRDASAERKEVRIYADPVFGSLDAKMEGKESRFMEGFQPTKLTPLPFTRVEAASVQRAATQNGWHATLVTGSAASESDLRSTPAPDILHFATHGLWLPRFGTELSPVEHRLRGVAGVDALARPTPRTGKTPFADVQAWREGYLTKIEVLSPGDPDFSNSMLRSVVALAGAQDTLAGWRAGQVRPGIDDGVLTAEEASMLDLNGTWLVTLSSCDSGVGEPEPGEGVIGLRRGFIEAGARNVLTTLWPVSDAWTPGLMADFYSQAMKTGDAAQSLASAQRHHLIQLRKEHGVEAAARLAGAFVLTTQTARQP